MQYIIVVPKKGVNEMIEFLMTKWVEVVAGILIMGALLVFVLILLIYDEYKDENREDEYADLKKQLPKLPKEKKRNDRL